MENLEITHGHSLRNAIQNFIKENIAMLIFTAMGLLIIYGSRITNLNVGIDTETALNSPGYPFGWLKIGRQGFVLTKFLLRNGNFNLYYASALGYTLLSFTTVAWCFLFYRVGKVSRTALFFFPVLFIVHPTFVEILYFKMLILEFSYAMLLIPIALLLEFEGAIHKKNSLLLLSIPLLIWIFSSYQNLMILYVAGILICILFLYRHLSLFGEKKPEDRFYVEIITRLIIVFLIAVALNGLITNLFFSKSTYLENYICWGVSANRDCLKSISDHIMQVLKGEGVFYSLGYVISLILALASIIQELIVKKAKYKWIYFLVFVIWLIVPFALTLYTGHIPPIRTQFLLPFVISGNIVLALDAWQNKNRMLEVGTIIIAILLFWVHGQIVFRLHYTDDVRYQNDVYLARRIAEKLDTTVSYIAKPIAFIGSIPATLNRSCVQGEAIGKSFFDWDPALFPRFTHSTARIANFMRVQGNNYEYVKSVEQMLAARKEALDMPTWPEDGSIVELDELIIVKLSEDAFTTYDNIVP